jgi:hypothetical protein
MWTKPTAATTLQTAGCTLPRLQPDRPGANAFLLCHALLRCICVCWAAVTAAFQLHMLV